MGWMIAAGRPLAIAQVIPAAAGRLLAIALAIPAAAGRLLGIAQATPRRRVRIYILDKLNREGAGAWIFLLNP